MFRMTSVPSANDVAPHRLRPAEPRDLDAIVGLIRETEDRVALAGEALVQLHDGLAQAGPPLRQFDEGVLDVGFTGQILEPFRQLDAGFAEHLAAARLGPEVAQLRIEPVEGNAEQHRQLALERCGVEDGEVGTRGVGDRFPDSLDQARPFEDLLRQRPRGRVVRAQHGQSRARMACRHAREEVQVVVEDQRVHRLRGDVHDVGSWVAQPDQQEEQPFLVERRAIELAQFVLVQRERRHDHRRAGLVGRAHHDVPDLVEARFQLLEATQFLFERERVGKWRLRNHSAAPSSSRERTSPLASIARGVVRSCSVHGRPSASAVRRNRRSR